MKTPAHRSTQKSSAVAAAPRPQTSPRIETDADIRTGIKALRRKCDVLRRIHDAIGDPPLRRRPPGFEGLARIIIGQQVSVASANAIWARVEQTVMPITAERIHTLPDTALLAAGLSRPKVRTLRAVADAVRNGLALEHLGEFTSEDARARLIAVSGIGPWTADVYQLFCLGDPDAFAPGDLALQVAAQLALGLSERPPPKTFDEISQRWRPWRGVAARLLWHYYAHIKTIKGAQPV